MRATRLPKLLLKALRVDSNTIGSVPLSVTKITGQTANAIEYRSTDDSTVLWGVDVAGGHVTNSGASLTKTVTVSISAASMVGTSAGQFGHASGVVLVADPGAGKFVELVSAAVSFTFGVAAYTGGGNVTVNSNGGSALTGLVSAANSFGASADKIIQFVPLSTAGNALTTNKGLNLVAASAFTDPGTAVGTAKVFVTYRVHTQ